MSTWVFVWKTYSREATRRQILKEIVFSSGKAYAISFTISSVIFLVSLVGYLLTIPSTLNTPLDTTLGANGFWIIPTLLFEFLSITILLSARDKYLARTQPSLDNSKKSLQNFDNGILRYMKFRSKLREHNINIEDIKNITNTLEARERLAESSGTYAKILAKYIAALMIALLVTIAKTMSVGSAFLTVFCLGVFGYLIYQIVSVVPAPPERVKELRYFLTMYQAELAASSAPLLSTNKELLPKNEEETA